jgi:hypothetical protein
MNRSRNTLTRSLVVALTTSTAVLAEAAAPAEGKGHDVVRRGSCTGATHWRITVGSEDGRLEVEGEIDGRAGHTWTWRLMHDGSVSAKGTRVTRRPSGSFEVRRVLVNLRGTDSIVLRARDTRTGERCVGTARF